MRRDYSYWHPLQLNPTMWLMATKCHSPKSSGMVCLCDIQPPYFHRMGHRATEYICPWTSQERTVCWPTINICWLEREREQEVHLTDKTERGTFMPSSSFLRQDSVWTKGSAPFHQVSRGHIPLQCGTELIINVVIILWVWTSSTPKTIG